MEQGILFLRKDTANITQHFFTVRPGDIVLVKVEGKPFFNLNTSMDEVLRTLALLPESGSIRGVARSKGHDKNAICRWVDLAGYQ